ncbi:MAG: sulfotransferase [Gammaproteobacteria bacterium]|nr:sulfotransferase [Gammaproteobacteria bacterium]NND55472.1 sulfotransferase [Gammaproteobacteria bacterium]
MVAQLDKHYVATRPARALARLISYACFEGRPLTTRGRWINPLLASAGRRIANRADAPTPDRPLFILGTGRSGTTILGKVLSMHRDVGWLNEPKLMWHLAAPFEDLNGNYTDAPARYRLDAGDASDAARQAISNLYATYLGTTRNSRVLDKYPEMIFRIPYIKALFPDARFIFLVRNGMDTCLSVSAWSDRHGATTSGERSEPAADWWGVGRRKWSLLIDQLLEDNSALAPHKEALRQLNNQTDMAAVEWILTMREGLRHMRSDAESFCMVRYENLTNAPDSELRRLLAFCQLEDDPVLRDYGERVLRAAPPKPAVALDERLSGEFSAVMRELGY